MFKRKGGGSKALKKIGTGRHPLPCIRLGYHGLLLAKLEAVIRIFPTVPDKKRIKRYKENDSKNRTKNKGETVQGHKKHGR